MADLATELKDAKYGGMTPEEVADAMNAKTVQRDRTSMTPSEVLTATDDAERIAVEANPDISRRFWDLMSMETLNPFGVEASIMVELYGGASVTITNLKAARVIKISRAEEEGLLGNSKKIGPAHIAAARLL